MHCTLKNQCELSELDGPMTACTGAASLSEGQGPFLCWAWGSPSWMYTWAEGHSSAQSAAMRCVLYLGRAWLLEVSVQSCCPACQAACQAAVRILTLKVLAFQEACILRRVRSHQCIMAC